MIPPTTAAASVPLRRSTFSGARFLGRLSLFHFRRGSSSFLRDWLWRERTHRGVACRNFWQISGSGWRGDFRSHGCTKTRGAFLRLGLPIGATEALRRGHVPFAGIFGFAIRLEIARQLKGDHGVARFQKEGRELSGGILAGPCSSDSCGDLLPIGHTVMAF